MEYIVIIIVFLLGTGIGSFLNVYVIRNHNEEDWVVDRSKCPHCKEILKWFELIPVISYVFQLGKCRYCGKKISIQYPLIELLVGSALVLSVINYNLSVDFLMISIIVVCLIGIMLSDLRYNEIPMFLVYLMILPGIFLTLFDSNIFTKFGGVLLALVFYGGQYLLTQKKGIGDGDIYLGAVVGFVLGLKALIVNIVITYLSALVFLTPLLIVGKLHRKSPVPLGAFICFSGILALLFPEVQNQIWNNIFVYIPL